MRWLSPLMAIALTILCGAMLFASLGHNPWRGMHAFFVLPVSDLYGLSELLLKATPLMLVSMGLAVGFRAGVWNIGAEGQFILGAVSASGIALTAGDHDAFWALPAMVLAGALGGALWAGIPAWLRTRFGTSEILVSLMLVYVAQLLASWLIYGPWKDPDGYNFPQTRNFGDSALLPMLIEGTRLHAGFMLALLMLIAGYVFLQQSMLGFRMQVGGQAPDAARYAGFSSKQAIWLGMLAGGALAGLAGMTEVAGPMGQLTGQISAGYGFAAIIVAFVGRLHPLGILGSSLVMALFFLGGEQAQQQLNLPSSISKVFQGMLLFFLLASDLFIAYRLRWQAGLRRA
ncbi:ABC transporter permease [Comamonas sp.]|uniref:ABC transporter permease n=1 Tax=Comamonas sp. TaxID=34028 RepID=UPI0025C22AF9|nr:ABC transporter permease [Comamonas sp.]